MMKVLAPLWALLALTLAGGPELGPLSDEQISYINGLPGVTWKAGRNFQLSELPKFKRMLGVNITESREYNKKYIKAREVLVSNDLPDTFDARTKWPQCPSLNEIRDQSHCGSCWAVSTAETITDRICIKGGGQVHISAEDINDCCHVCGDGCEGGIPGAVYDWYVSDGIVTGGQYGSNQGCKPYSLPKCGNMLNSKYPVCPHGNAQTPECKTECREGYNLTYTEDKRKGSKSYTIQGVQQIMQDLVDNGPVTAVFEVYSDFGSYKTGVYKHLHGDAVDGHAVKIIGYGAEGDQDYWLVANSWNEEWGDKGFFKIARGTNECGIEGGVVAGEPKL